MPAGGAARSLACTGSQAPSAARCKGKCRAWLSFGRKLELAALNSVSRRREAFEPGEVSVAHGDFNATSW